MDDKAVTRREVLRYLGIGAAGVVGGNVLGGCATDPVTGKNQLMLMSQAQEVAVDQEHSPHQFSADYGAAQDQGLNRYIDAVGGTLAARSHRPEMPYSFRAVNAAYINAYAFPGGSIAATRGILLEMENEAELAGLLGHELGHVNARHTAEQATTGMLVNAAVMGGAAYASTTNYRDYAGVVAALGGLGGGALLAHYSRDNEREADALGMEYMTKTGYNPEGMVGLMEILEKKGHEKPSAIEMMFATHPMSSERLATARETAGSRYGQLRSLPLGRERYMDHTAGLRKQKETIVALQNGDKEMREKRYSQAEALFGQALKKTPEDYAALVMMAKCQVAQGRPAEAKRYTERARSVYPQEAQALHIEGLALMMTKRFDEANAMFSRYEQVLPGNGDTVFFKALSFEGMGNRQAAAREYSHYLNFSRSGSQAQHAYKQLVNWGYVSPSR